MDIYQIYNKELIDKELEKAFEEYKVRYFGKFYYTYQSLAKKFYSAFKINVKDQKKNQQFNEIAKYLDLDLTLSDVQSLSTGFLLISIIISIVLTIVFQQLIIFIVSILVSLLGYLYLSQYPYLLYSNLKNKKRGQLVQVLLFLSMKLRENPNLEQSFIYLSKYVDFPIKLDFLIILRDTYNKKFSSIEEALDYYSKQWEEDAYFFSLGIELLLAALRESDPNRRQILIDDALRQSLDSLIDSLSYFARELQEPINLVSTLGITLPTLLLTIFPLASSFLSNAISTFFLFFLFDVTVPIFVYMNIKMFIAQKYKSIFFEDDYLLRKRINSRKILKIIVAIGSAASIFILLFFSLVFVVYNYLNSYSMDSILLSGIFIFSLGSTISFAAFLYYSQNKKLYESVGDINRRLITFLLSLSNVMSRNIPLESALFYLYPRFSNNIFGDIIMELYTKIRSGLTFYDALFDEQDGILVKYPSMYLHSAFEVLYESSSISPKNASQTAAMVARSFTYVERVKERLKDLVAEPISQLKAMQNILAPAILGIIVSTAIMTIYILYRLGLYISNIQVQFSGSNLSSYDTYVPLSVLSIFSLSSSVTPASIFLIVGLFNILITILITMIVNIIENEGDILKYYKELYKSLFLSNLLFVIISTFGSLALYSLAANLLVNL